jgi:hypothetical protein
MVGVGVVVPPEPVVMLPLPEKLSVIAPVVVEMEPVPASDGKEPVEPA